MIPPALATQPPSEHSLADRAEIVASRVLGSTVLPWQRDALQRALAINPDTGRLRYGTVILTVPRQCGKSHLLGIVAVTRMMLASDTRCWMTAQTGKDARDRWREITSAVQSASARTLAHMRQAQGQETLTIGASTLRVFSPQPDALHGNAIDHVSVDEVFAFDALRGSELEQAIIPAMATRAQRGIGTQLWLTSTAGDETSAWLRRWDELGQLAAADPHSSICYIRYSAPDDAADPASAHLWHPGVADRLISADTLRQARDVMPAPEYARAFGNRWVAARTASIIDPAAWLACLDAASVAADPASIAVDVAIDGSAAAIAAASPAGERWHLEIIEHRAGIGWIAGRLRELQRAYRVPIQIDAGGPSGQILPACRQHGVRMVDVGMRDVARAAQGLLTAIREQQIIHIGQASLDDAVRAALSRPLADAWTWGRRRSSADISPLVAATLAHYGAHQRQTRSSVSSAH